MRYQVVRDDQNVRASIQLDGKEVWCLEREDQGRGHWLLHRVVDGVKGPAITRDQYSNDLIETVTVGLVLAGHVAQVEGGVVVPVPVDVGDFYVSGFGYLCSRNPVRMVLSEFPLPKELQGHSIRMASPAEKLAAGLSSEVSAAFVGS